ncbi:MAG: dNTP triphosphohydrolase [Nitrosomonadales bacterium]|nr:dNTP triphosphohydrolase [Nitrosomonadales bacterium]
MLYSKGDLEREYPLQTNSNDLKLRPPFRRDYARLIHSPAFRRLQGKTQLFPGIESDFFRNRLTHSLEVAQIAKSIAIRINETTYQGKTRNDLINLDLVEFAGLAHDLGHPPFGHNGELALNACMRNAGGFEGNAQTLRILAKLEKKGNKETPFSGAKKTDSRIGLNLTHRTLASILKYDKIIPVKTSDKLQKGYYSSEAGLVKNIKRNVIAKTGYRGDFKTIECQIMDLADDIAYSTYDLEDALKAGFISPMEILSDTLNDQLMGRIAQKVTDRTKIKFSADEVIGSLYNLFLFSGLFDEDDILSRLKGANTKIKKFTSVTYSALQSYEVSRLVSQDGYSRNELTSSLVDRFVQSVECKWKSGAPDLPPVALPSINSKALGLRA